jgi:hypothetical protein
MKEPACPDHLFDFNSVAFGFGIGALRWLRRLQDGAIATSREIK